MLSRVAHNLYWFARYLRRAETTARLVGVGSQLQLDLPRSVRFAWRPMIDTVGASELYASLSPAAGPMPSDVDVVRFLLLDTNNPSSLRSSVDSAREILRSIRDRLPQQTWEAVTDLHFQLDDADDRSISRRHRTDFLHGIVDCCLKVSGLLSANASRDLGYQFMRLGTALEQADMTTRIIDAGECGLVSRLLDDDREVMQSVQWLAVLRSLEGYQMYRRHVRQRVTAEHALRFLLQNDEFPRSVQFCLARAQQVLSLMPSRDGVAKPLQRAAGLIRNADPAALAAANAATFMDEIQLQLGRLDRMLTDEYFTA